VNAFLRLIAFARPYRGRLAAAAVAMIAYGAASAGVARLIQPILDRVLPRHEELGQIIAAILILYLIKGVGAYLSGYWMTDVGQRVVREEPVDRAEQLAMIDLDVRALTDLSLAFIDSLKRRRGGILNVASIAAFLPGPGMAVYYASKAYVLSFSEALHRELKPKGVRVTALCPGPVPTEFQARAGMGDDALPGFLTRSAEQVASDGYCGLMQGRRVVVPGAANRAVTMALRLAPRGLLLDLIARQQRGPR